MAVTYRPDASHERSENSSEVPHVELEILRGAARERIRAISSGAFLIGTAADCDLILGDPQFPSVHSCLLRGPSGVTIRHLGFNPELVVNDQPVEYAALQDGDRLGLGRYEFLVHVRARGPSGGESTKKSVAIAPLAARVARRKPDEKARAQVRALLAEIQRTEANSHEAKGASTLRLYIERETPPEAQVKKIRRA
jgi:predicted component of type VI protein secretion system